MNSLHCQGGWNGQPLVAFKLTVLHDRTAASGVFRESRPLVKQHHSVLKQCEEDNIIRAHGASGLLLSIAVVSVQTHSHPHLPTDQASGEMHQCYQIQTQYLMLDLLAGPPDSSSETFLPHPRPNNSATDCAHNKQLLSIANIKRRWPLKEEVITPKFINCDSASHMSQIK